ncbi:HlyD family efflux transporter periplasmic adaptor subunit [Halochromatium sp.]
MREGDTVSAGQVLLRILPIDADTAEHQVRAPWDGSVARAYARVEGREVKAQMLLFELFDPDSLVLRFSIDGSRTLGLAPGQRVQARFDGAPADQIELILTRAWPALEPETGQRIFEAQLPERADVAIGMAAQVRVESAVAGQGPALTTLTDTMPT